MLDEFLEHPFFLNRHRQAPLLKERESFLNHLQQQGTSRKALRNLSAELLQVVRLLKLTEMRDVTLEEIRRAARCWARQQRTNPKAHSYGNSASSFIYAHRIPRRLGRNAQHLERQTRHAANLFRLLDSTRSAEIPAAAALRSHNYAKLRSVYLLAIRLTITPRRRAAVPTEVLLCNVGSDVPHPIALSVCNWHAPR